MPEVVTLDEFAAMTASIRDGRNEAAEGYRFDPSTVDAQIEFWTEYFEKGIVPDPPGIPAPVPRAGHRVFEAIRHAGFRR